MAAINHGTAFLFGVNGTIATAAVQSVQIKDEHQNNTQVMDEIGNEVTNRHDDLVNEGTITLKFESGYTPGGAETLITFDTVEYRITSVDRNEVNNDHREITYGIKTTEYIDLSP